MRRVLTKTSVVRCACDHLRELRVDLLPDFGRHHRFQRRRRDFDREITRTDVTRIDDGAILCHVRIRCSDQKARDLFHRLLRRGESHARRRLRGQRGEPFQRQREMAAALVRRQCVDLVDDDGARGGKHRPARLRTEQDVERLGSRHDDMGRPPPHARAFRLRGVAGAYQGTNVHVGKTERFKLRTDAGERSCQVLLDIVRQRLQRRDIDNERLIRQRCLDALPHQFVDSSEERGERLARAGRRGDEHIPSGLNQRPGPCLGFGRFAKVLPKPGVDSGMEGRFALHQRRLSQGVNCLDAGSSRKCRRYRSRRSAPTPVRSSRP